MRRILTLTAALAVTAVLASCSGGDASDTGSSSPATSESPSASETASPSATETAAEGITGGFGADDDVVESCAGVGIEVNVGNLDDDREDAAEASIEAAEGAWCIDATEALTAREALDLAGVTTEGTTEYGDAVVCRVNGVPAADLELTDAEGGVYTEQCESMPAAFAYWSMWLKPAGGAWDYAMEGVDTQQLAPGDRLELLFTLNGEPVNPDTETAG